MKHPLAVAFALLAFSQVTVALFAPVPAAAIEPVYTGLFSDLALDGYDPVAYFTDGRPVPGRAEFELAWRGATWRFASAEHRALFEADPERYAPRYGGYCAWAMAQGREASGDPRFWKIVGGRLYLNYDASVQKKWEADIPGFIERADANWPRLLAE
ncbi:MAG: YHS domain-containing (seleno)protein [Myxococcota bacterium]